MEALQEEELPRCDICKKEKSKEQLEYREGYSICLDCEKEEKFNFKLVYPNATQLRNYIEFINQMVDETTFTVDEKGLSTKAVDRATVCVVDFQLSNLCLEKFETKKPFKFGINLTNLLSILKNADKDDKVRIENTESKLKIVLSNEYDREFEIPLLDITQEDVPPTEDLQFTAKAIIPIKPLDKALKDIDTIADFVIFETEERTLKITSSGEVSNYRLELPTDETNPTNKSRYPLDYLKKILTTKKEFDYVVMSFANDYPLKLEFLEGDKMSLTYVLAPRVSDE